MHKSDIIFPYLQSSILFKWPSKFVSDKGYLKNGW